MRWANFAIFTFILLVVEHGMIQLWAIPAPPPDGVTPSLMLIMMVFVAMFAPTMTLAWAGIVLGLLVDLTWPADWVSQIVIIGPHALGFLAGAYLTVYLRNMFFRQSSLTLTVMVFFAGLLAHLVVVGLLWLRTISWPGPDPVSDLLLVERFFSLFYTTVMAVPVGFLLFKVHLAFGFQSTKKGRR